MRTMLLAFIAATLLLTAPAALAAPACQDRSGDSVGCMTRHAMPAGWTLSTEQRLRMQAERPPVSRANLFGLGCFLIGFFALVLLMPNFDGDWDRQGQDDEEPQ
jgi:hypothetical protein